MAEVQSDNALPTDGPRGDRRRGGPLGRAQRTLVTVIRSRWLAMFAIAFSVSWAFHQVDEIADRKIEKQQRIIECTIEGVDKAQRQVPPPKTISVGTLLEACQKQEGN